MLTRKAAPFGSWKSPVNALVVSQNREFSEVSVDKESIYWLETRPENQGRRTIVTHTRDGTRNRDVTSDRLDVGTRVYEYGGGSYTVVDDTLFFSNLSDMKVYAQKGNARPKAVTSNTPRFRYADFVVDKRRDCIICVREEHKQQRNAVVNTIVSIPLKTPNDGTVIVDGDDFYLSPRLSPDGSTLAWISWNFPNMPWDGSDLWTAKVGRDGSLGGKVKISGRRDEAVLQPEWAPDGTLYFVSDRTGWWNIYRVCDRGLMNMHPMKAEFGEPQWRLAMSLYAVGSSYLVCAYIRDGIFYLATIDTESKKFKTLDLPFTEISSVRSCGNTAAFCGSNPSTPSSIVQLNLLTEEWEILRKSTEMSVNPRYVSVPERLVFPTNRGRTVHAFFYPPKNQDYRSLKNEKPPLLVKAHGGPTHASAASFDLHTQFFTSRGFAVLDVNYGGSSGYGRKYRERLNRSWGVVDVEDCENGAKFICARSRADQKRLLIRGGSAGGFTTLASLAFRKLYRAGACYYGISDLQAWARDTHKFESRYLDKMIGAYRSRREQYISRSPARFASRISAPLVVFQGLDDKVVPPTQSQLIVNAMRKKKLPVTYIEFNGEGHGFHVAKNIRQALELEINLYSKTLGI